MKNPIAEQTALDLKVNYSDFLEKDKAHRDALLKKEDQIKDDKIQNMQDMMK